MIKKISTLINFLNKNKLYAESKFLSKLKKYAARGPINIANLTKSDAKDLEYWQIPNILRDYSFTEINDIEAAKALYFRALSFKFHEDMEFKFAMDWLRKKSGVTEPLPEPGVDADSDQVEMELEKIRENSRKRKEELDAMELDSNDLDNLRKEYLKSDDEESRRQGYEFAKTFMDAGYSIEEIFGIRPLKEIFYE